MKQLNCSPGPWQVHGPGSMRVCDGRHDSEEGCQTILEAEIIGVDRETAEANAVLGAAARDLYEALILCTDAMLGKVHPKNPAWLTAHKALAKARAHAD